MKFLLFGILFALTLFSSGVYFTDANASQTVSNRIVIDDDDIPTAIEAGDLFGYQIEPIGDLDSDGTTDLAVIKFSDDSGEVNAGSVVIMFMNSNGSVKGTNEIVMDATAAGIGASCIVGDSTNRDIHSLEQLAFVGDLDSDGEPTLALAASSNDHPDVGTGGDSGAIYMLELNTDGTVDNCFRIIPSTPTEDTGFAPDDGVYNEIGDPTGNDAALGWPLIATDLNSDGQNELITGADSEDNSHTNLWPLFLNSTGGVDSHPTIPIFGNSTYIGIDPNDWIDDGISIDGGTKLAVSTQKAGVANEGAVFIVDVTSAGAFVSSTEIITGISLNQTAGFIDAFGSGLAPLGDMDNDGVNDILVGNELGDDINKDSGEAYILYMNSDNTVKESQKISNESEFTRTGVAPFGTTDLFGHGMALWQLDGNNAVIAISATQSNVGGGNAGSIHLFYIQSATVLASVGESGDDDRSHLTSPTFGKDWYRTDFQLVECGFSLQGICYDVTDNWHTDFEMKKISTGLVHNIGTKVHAVNGGLWFTEIAFGIPDVGKFDEPESLITVFYNQDKTIERIEIKQEYSLVTVNNVTASQVDCREANDSQCYQTDYELTFSTPLRSNIVGIQAVDFERRNLHPTYLNEGIEIIGPTFWPNWN